MRYPIKEIEGIGATHGNKLVKAGISRTDQLLERCATPAKRKALAGETGLTEGQLLKWANLADLMRITGIGKQYSELLEAAGVDTVKELKHRRPDNLGHSMREVNASKRLARQVPAEKQIAGWVEQAKSMPPAISY